MKVALLGASGLLGWSVYQELNRRGFNCFQYCQQPFGHGSTSSFRFLDLVDEVKLTRELLDEWPDAIINCAAVSSPNLVNQDPEGAAKLNVNVARRLAELSSHLGARLIHFSSDMVFEGREQPYRSTDMPKPISEYGNQKLESEKKVLSAIDENVVVLRLTLINGNSPRANRSPHERIFESIQNDQPLTFLMMNIDNLALPIM